MTSHAHTSERSAAGAASRQFSTFYLDGLYLGVEVLQVQELIRYQDMTRVPLAPSLIRGLINLRGQIVTAIELRRRFDMPDRAADRMPMNVVVRMEGGAVSLLVDEIGDVVEVTDEQFEPAPETIRGRANDLVIGVYKMAECLLLVLDVERAIAVDRFGAGRPAA
jgi:purine-binding chemotaxis protein CheW